MEDEKKEPNTAPEVLKEDDFVLTEEEKQLEGKAKRTPEQIKKLFVEKYEFDEDDERLDRLVDREMAHSKVVSTLIGQKSHWRDKAKKATKPEGDTQKKPNPDDSLEKVKTPKRVAAVEKFLKELKQKYPDRDIKEMYEKLNPNYKEDGSEIVEEDFNKKLTFAFKGTFPDLYEEEIRHSEREKLKEGLPEIDFSNIGTPASGDKKIETTKFSRRSEPITDWYKPKK